MVSINKGSIAVCGWSESKHLTLDIQDTYGADGNLKHLSPCSSPWTEPTKLRGVRIGWEGQESPPQVPVLEDSVPSWWC